MDADDAIGMILNWNSDEDSSGDPLDESDDDEFEVDSDSDDDIPEIQENSLSDGFADTASSDSGGEDDDVSTFRKMFGVVLANVHRFRVITDFRMSLLSCTNLAVHKGFLVNKYSAHIYFRLFSAWPCLAENLLKPKFRFARFSVTVYTGSSSTGQKIDAAEVAFSHGRPKFEWAENLWTYSTPSRDKARALTVTVSTTALPCKSSVTMRRSRVTVSVSMMVMRAR